MLLLVALMVAQVPTARTIKTQVGEERPLSICQLSVQASTVVRGRVLSVGSTVQLADASQAYLFTPIVFAPTEVLAGPAAVLHTFTLYMVGELVNGQSQNGASFLSPSGVGVEGVAFFVEHGGLKFIHAGGGWFWDSGGGNFVNAFAKGSTGQSLDTLRQVVSTSVAGNGGCVKRAVPSAGSGAIK